MFSYSSSTALVTGASRGIGAEIARALARRGIQRLILTARSENDLETLAGELAVNHDVPVTVIPADLTQAGAAQKLHDEVVARGLNVDLLVNNAGFGFYGPFEDAEADRDSRMIALNIESLVALTRLFLPTMKANYRGGVLNVASTAAFQPVPYMATYAATKAFVLSFSEALWAECRESGVNVVCLCPGGTETAFDFGTGEGSRFKEAPRDSPEMVATVGLDALDRGRSHVVAGLGNTLIAHSSRFAPRSMVALAVASAFKPRAAKDDAEEKTGRDIADVVATAKGLLSKPAVQAGVAVAGLALVLAVMVPGAVRAARKG